MSAILKEAMEEATEAKKGDGDTFAEIAVQHLIRFQLSKSSNGITPTNLMATIEELISKASWS